MNKKCLVSETRTALRTSETAVKEGKWVVVVMMMMMMMMMICFGKWQCKSTKRLYHAKYYLVHHKLLPQNSCNIMYPADMFCFKYITVDTLHVIHNMVQRNVACRYVLKESLDTH